MLIGDEPQSYPSYRDIARAREFSTLLAALCRDPARFGCAARFDRIPCIDRADKAEPRGMAKRNPFAAIAHGHELAEAIIDAIREPLLVLDPDLRVIAASRSFYRTFAVTPRKTGGRQLSAQRLISKKRRGRWPRNHPKGTNRSRLALFDL